MKLYVLALFLLAAPTLRAQPTVTFHYDRGVTDSVPRFSHVHYYEVYPLSRGFFFDRGNENLSEWYLPEGEDRYRREMKDRLIPGGTLRKNRYLIDILGWRMTNVTDGALALQPTYSLDSGETFRLAFRRGWNIRGYLTEEWGIDSSRIDVLDPLPVDCRKGDSLCYEDARFVRLESSDLHLLAPITVSFSPYYPWLGDVAVTVTPSPESDVEQVWMRWRLGSDSLFSRRMEKDGTAFTLRIKLSDSMMIRDYEVLPGEVPISIDVWGENSTGDLSDPESAVFDRTGTGVSPALHGARTAHYFDTNRYTRYLLPLLDRNGSNLDTRVISFLAEIFAREKTIYECAITGYFSAGEDPAVASLRAERVETEIRRLHPELDGVIERKRTEGLQPMYHQDTPEGRMHNRTVQVLLRVPRTEE